MPLRPISGRVGGKEYSSREVMNFEGIMAKYTRETVAMPRETAAVRIKTWTRKAKTMKEPSEELSGEIGCFLGLSLKDLSLHYTSSDHERVLDYSPI